MDRRMETHIEMALPVRIWGVDSFARPFMQLASVCDLSSEGAVLRNVRARIRPGEVLDVQYGGQHAQFRVIWAGRPGTLGAGALGIERLPLEPHIWDVDLARCGQVVGKG